MVSRTAPWVTTSSEGGYAATIPNHLPDIICTKGTPYAVGKIALDRFATVQEQAAKTQLLKIEKIEDELASCEFESFMNGCAFSNKYAFIRQSQDDKTNISCFDLRSGRKMKTFEIQKGDEFDKLKWCDETLFCISTDRITAIDIDSESVKTFSTDFAIREFESWNGQLIATTFQNEYYIWSLTSKNEIKKMTFVRSDRRTAYYPFACEGERVIFACKWRRDMDNSYFALVNNKDLEPKFSEKDNTFRDWSFGIGNYIIAKTLEGSSVRHVNQEIWKKFRGDFLNLANTPICCLQGKFLFTAEKQVIKTWNIESGELMMTHQFEESVSDIHVWNNKIVVAVFIDDSSKTKIKILNIIPESYYKFLNGKCYKPMIFF